MGSNGDSMSKSKSGIYEYDKIPGESLDSFMRRHRIHPEDGNPRLATPQEEALVARTTREYVEGAFILVPIPPE